MTVAAGGETTAAEAQQLVSLDAQGEFAVALYSEATLRRNVVLTKLASRGSDDMEITDLRR